MLNKFSSPSEHNQVYKCSLTNPRVPFRAPCPQAPKVLKTASWLLTHWLVWFIFELCINYAVLYVFFCFWLPLNNGMFVRFIHIAVYRNLFIFIAYMVFRCTNIWQFTYPFYWWTFSFRLLWIMLLWIFLYTFLAHVCTYFSKVKLLVIGYTVIPKYPETGSRNRPSFS